MAQRLRYCHPSDRVTAAATLSLSGFTAQTLYPLTYVKNLNPALPFKANEQSGRILLDFGTATSIAFVALIHHNLDAALSVKWQAHASDPVGAAFSQAFTIGAPETDRYRPNSYLDLSAAPPNYRYHSLYVEGTNSLDVILGELWVATTVRQLVHNFKWQFKRNDVRPGRKSWKTPAGVDWTYPSLGRQRALTGGIDTTDAGMAAIADWQQACGGPDQSMVIVPDAPDMTDAVLGKWTMDFEYEGEFIDVDVLPVAWLELARGVPWP